MYLRPWNNLSSVEGARLSDLKNLSFTVVPKHLYTSYWYLNMWSFTHGRLYFVSQSRHDAFLEQAKNEQYFIVVLSV